MGECVEKRAHECGSRSGLQVFLNEDETTYSGYCFSCNTYVADPYGRGGPKKAPKAYRKTQEEIQAELDEVTAYPVVTLTDRRLRDYSLDYFGIKIGLSEEDGDTPATHHYPYRVDGRLVAYKNRIISNKKMWSTGSMDDVDLFGWEEAVKAGGKRLFITEGELDAVSLYQTLKLRNKGTQYEDIDYAVVSLPKGAAHAVKAISSNIDKIRKSFKEVVLVFDEDEAGQTARDQVVRNWGDFLTATLPDKDANACVLNGKTKALASAVLFNADVPKNSSIIWGGSLHEAGRTEAKWGYSWPWKGLTELTRGIRLGETYYIGAGAKMGKSEIVNTIGAHCIIEHKWKVFMAKPEEANRKSYQMVVGKAVGRIFHDPKIPFDFDAYDKGSKLIGDNLGLMDLYQNITWAVLKDDIRSAALHGCKAIIIDPITNLTNGMEAAKANVVLQEIAQALSVMAKDLNVAIFIFCHLKAPTSGDPHEKGGEVFSTQFAGSRAMMRSCNLMIGIEGNKDEELDIAERNIRRLRILEDREFGNVGSIRIWWNNESSLFSEITQ